MLFAYALPPGAILVQGRAILDLHCFRAWAPYREKGDPHSLATFILIYRHTNRYIYIWHSVLFEIHSIFIDPLKLYQPIYTNHRESSALFKQGRESHTSNHSGRFSRAIPDIGSGALLQGLIYLFNLWRMIKKRLFRPLMLQLPPQPQYMMEQELVLKKHNKFLY